MMTVEINFIKTLIKRNFSPNLFRQDSEIILMDNTEDIESVNEVAITESSWIDWEDHKRLENFVKKQTTLETNQGFDMA